MFYEKKQETTEIVKRETHPLTEHVSSIRHRNSELGSARLIWFLFHHAEKINFSSPYPPQTFRLGERFIFAASVFPTTHQVLHGTGSDPACDSKLPLESLTVYIRTLPRRATVMKILSNPRFLAQDVSVQAREGRVIETAGAAENDFLFWPVYRPKCRVLAVRSVSNSTEKQNDCDQKKLITLLDKVQTIDPETFIKISTTKQMDSICAYAKLLVTFVSGYPSCLEENPCYHLPRALFKPV
ncbi:hypothetical protein AAG570_001805 [Ranatra chinensis]|uniref:Uncharacterized protein n=1 Tax=Ranatra chinensis TaxID=642074 RepID=A0ABD0Y9K8_9HEMI